MTDLDVQLAINDIVKNVTAVAPEQFADQQTAREEFMEYDNLRSLNPATISAADEQRRVLLRQKVVSMMNLDPITAVKLQYTDEMSEVNAKQDVLQSDAERSGLDKVTKDLFGTKKSAAKKKLAKTEKQKKQIRDSVLQRTADERLEEGERSYEVSKEYDERLEEGKNSGAMLQRFCNNMLIGTAENRLREYPVPEYEDTVTEPVSIATDEGVLQGVLHRPMVKPTGKLVIYYSGNTASTMSQSKDSAKTHLDSGANVLCVDYRGFGKSISVDKEGSKKDTAMVEEGMYRDSMAIYKYATETLTKNASDIILHGYSLGGSMASRVAAQVSINNAHAESDRKVTENERLGGLILQSPINSAYNVARLTLSTPEKFRANKTGKIVNGLAKLLRHSSGKFSTEDHMQAVAKYDPNIPVLFLSGSSKVHNANEDRENPGDFLSLQDTKVDVLSGVTNTATFIGEHVHEPKHMKFKDVADPNKSSDVKLDTLLKFGRATDLRVDNQTEPVAIKGFKNNDAYQQPVSIKLAYISQHTEKHTNTLLNTPASVKFMDFCKDNTSLVAAEGTSEVSKINIPDETTAPQLKKILMESKPYATCVCTMTHIGKQVMLDNPPQMDDAALMANLTKPMEEGVEQNGASNLQNVIESRGKMEENSFNYFMKNDQIQTLYKEMQTGLSKIPFFESKPEMMGQALALLFADLSLQYTTKLNPHTEKDKTGFGLLARNKSIMFSNLNSKRSAEQFSKYVHGSAFDAVTASITSSTANVITQDIINKRKGN